MSVWCRIPGSGRTLTTWIEKINSDPGFELGTPNREFKAATVASLVVKFLMGTNHGNNHKLPHEDDGVWGSDFTMAWKPYSREDETVQVQALKKMIAGLPASNRHTLKIITAMFVKICDHGHLNKMTPAKLALCVFPAYQSPAIVMIENFDEIFEE